MPREVNNPQSFGHRGTGIELYKRSPGDRLPGAWEYRCPHLYQSREVLPLAPWTCNNVFFVASLYIKIRKKPPDI